MIIIRFIAILILGYFLGVLVTKKDQSEASQNLLDSKANKARTKKTWSSPSVAHSETQKFVSVSETLEDFLLELKSADVAGLSELVKELNSLTLDEKAIRIPLIFAMWAEKDPESALHAASFIDRGKNKDNAIAVVLGVWTKRDPLSAAETYKKFERNLFTRNYDDSRDQISGSQVVVRGLLKEEGFNTAFDWVKQLNNIADKKVALQKLFSNLTDESPNEAIEQLEKLNPTERDYIVKRIAEQWSKSAPSSAVEWVNGLDGETQKLVLPSLVSGLADEDPKLASEYLDFIEENRDQEIQKVLLGWADLDINEAGDWFLQDIREDEQEAIVGGLVQKWVSQNSEQARGWLLDQSPGIVRDRGIESYVSSAVSGIERPEELIEWVNNVEMSTESRYRAINSALVAWTRTNPEEADQFATNLQLPAEVYADYLFEVSAESPLD